jgi:hypothetical protein
VKSLLKLILDGSKDPMKQTRACKMSLKQPQNEARLNPKPTPKNKKDKTNV